MKGAVATIWTILAIFLITLAGKAVTADQTETGTYLQFDSSRHLVIPSQVTLGASSDHALVLYREGSKDAIVGLPAGVGDHVNFVFQPVQVNPGKWINANHAYSVSYTISSDKPVTVTLVNADPGGDWFTIIMVGFVFWAIVLLIILQ